MPELLTGGGAGTRGEQHHERAEDGLVVQQRLPGLGQQHLVHPELLQLHVLGELSPQAPQEQPLHHALQNHELQDGPHGSAWRRHTHSQEVRLKQPPPPQRDGVRRVSLTLPRLLLHQQEQHVLHVVLDGAGLVRRDRTEPDRPGAAAVVVVSMEEAQSSGGAAARLVSLQDLCNLRRHRRSIFLSFPQTFR